MQQFSMGALVEQGAIGEGMGGLAARLCGRRGWCAGGWRVVFSLAMRMEVSMVSW